MLIRDMPHKQKFMHPQMPGTVWQKLHAECGKADGINYVIIVVESKIHGNEVPFLASTDITERHAKTEYTPIDWK